MVSWIKVTDIQCIIERAGELIKEVYNKRNFNVELKRDNTPVTEADKISSEYITSALKKLYPEIPVISEEASLPAYEEREKWAYAWIIDPLVVQRNLYIGMGVFVLILLLSKRENPYSG